MVWVYTIPSWEYPKEPITLEEFLKKAAGPHGILTTRDLDILDTLYYHRFLLNIQVAKLFFPESKTPPVKASQRMKILFDRGLVLRFRPIVSKHEGTHQFIYALSQLGYDVLFHIRKRYDKEFEDEPRWQETNNVVEMSRLIHDLELNEFCITVKLECEKRGINYTWWPTRLTWQKVTPKQLMAKPYMISPDAVIRIDNSLFHVEYERSANPERFFVKTNKWKRYRSTGAWKEKWTQEPTILVVGGREPGEVKGKSRKEKSIIPLIDITLKQGLENIFFLFDEDWQNGNWVAYTVRNERVDIFNLTNLTSWDRLKLY
ncbi:MAG: hypothetical protein A4E53_00353 [Pelotomaculum sp. PtaB.Bin104]|nr:MAG: hypothetical protein A4E53_00353 [Pelotomaculum sp. PtaB.Bin104]OPY62243.1 MAG: hypothetical protein A4E56_01436 [Pelotomaculum sp. PtaU1.Bin065]